MDREFRQALLHEFAIAAFDQDAFGCAGFYREQTLVRFFVDRYRALESGSRTQKRIAEDTVHPCPEICPRLEGAESAQCFGVRLLYQVLRFGRVLREPARKVKELVEQG